MPGPLIQATFATGSVAAAGNISDVLTVPTSTTAMKLTTTGLSGSNQIKTQKRTAGGTFADQTTYSSDQNATSIPVAAGEEWRLVQVSQLPIVDVRYKMSCES